MISVATTKYFFVLNISRNGLHKGFNVQGSIMREVQKAICAFDTSISENIRTETIERATNGNPIAK
jgi:hypothetical protein